MTPSRDENKALTISPIVYLGEVATPALSTDSFTLGYANIASHGIWRSAPPALS
jgi:hypothetical protein